MFRYSMVTLLSVMLVLGVFCAALANPGFLFTRVIFAVTCIFLLYWTLAAVLNRSRRPFTWGFAVAGWAYFLLTFSWIAFPDKRLLLTYWVTDEVVHAVHEDTEDMELNEIMALRYTTEGAEWEEYYCFHMVCQCLWTLIFATISGLAACWLQRPHPPPPPPTPKTNLDQP